MTTTQARVHVVDSHTEGEPTRVVLDGAPSLSGSTKERRHTLDRHHLGFQKGVLREPRGFEAMVGAVLNPPQSDDACAEVIFFNNAGTLEMCVHGVIGVARTLHHLGRIGEGTFLLDTPAGPVGFTIDDEQQVTVRGVPSYRTERAIAILAPSVGEVEVDIAYGGNWFALVRGTPLTVTPSNIPRLTVAASEVRRELRNLGIVGTGGEEIDHVEFFGPPTIHGADSKNFVLCPGSEFDRSPCGTGTSAKMACLALDGVLEPGARWVQESIIGTTFEGSVTRMDDDRFLPELSGKAWVTGEAHLIHEASDPFPEGIALP